MIAPPSFVREKTFQNAEERRPTMTGLATRYLEHLECSYQPHIQGQGAKKRTQRAG